LRGWARVLRDVFWYESGLPKECVHQGKKTVLVDPDHKRLLTIANQEAARDRVGDYVEINGDFNEQAQSRRIDSTKLLEKGRAMCDVPAKKKT